MAAAKSKKSLKKAPKAAEPAAVAIATAAEPAAAAPAAAALKFFYDGAGKNENFGFTRAYWPAEGHRESIQAYIDKKMNPLRATSGESLAVAARSDLLLPPQAPQEYMDVGHLVSRYEEMLPAHELNAFAQVTIRFPGAPNLHQPWEMVRRWAQGFYAGKVPVLLILHAPHLAGSNNPGHVHCIVLPRQLAALGWVEMERWIASDEGQRKAYESWTAFQDEQASAL